MRKVLPLLFLMALTWSLPGHSEQLLIVAPNVERAQQAKLEAGYRALNDLIIREAGLQSRLEFMPIADVRARLARREAQMQIGGICGVKRHVPVIYSVPFARTVRHLVSVDDSPVLTELKDLRRHHLGLVKGYFYQLPDARGLKGLGVQVHYSKDLKNSIQLLLVGRVDTILANGYVASSIAKAMKQEQRLNFQADAPFSERNFCYVLPANAESEDLAASMNRAIVSLYHSGRLQQALVPPYQTPKAKYLKLKGNSLQ